MVHSLVLHRPVKPTVCRRCKGARFDPSTMHEDFTSPCIECDGSGRMIYLDDEDALAGATVQIPTAASTAVERLLEACCDIKDAHEETRLRFPSTPASNVTWSYIATSGTDLVEEGLSLERFIGDLVEDWPELDENLAIWRIEVGTGPRLVACIYPGPKGESLVKWI